MKNIAIMAAMVFATATGAQADAFGECGAKTALTMLATVDEPAPALDDSSAVYRAFESQFTSWGETARAVLAQGFSIETIEAIVTKDGGGEQLLNVIRACHHKL